MHILFAGALVLSWQAGLHPGQSIRMHGRASALLMVQEEAQGPKGPAAPQDQVASAAAQKAVGFLGKLGVQAVQKAAEERASGQPVETKEFVASVKVNHRRTIIHGPKPLPEYMRLPVDQYALYDPRLMKRVPQEDSSAAGDIFELSLPTMRPAPGTFAPRPKFRVRVTPADDELKIESISATLFESDQELPANMSAADLKLASEKMGQQLSLGFNTTIAWAAPRRRSAAKLEDGQEATELTTGTAVQLKLRLPPPFTRVPRPVIQGSIGLVMRFVAQKVLPQFVSLLEADYQRWANGTRDLQSGLGGNLVIDDEGYMVVSQEVLDRMETEGEQGRKMAATLRASASPDAFAAPGEAASNVAFMTTQPTPAGQARGEPTLRSAAAETEDEDDGDGAAASTSGVGFGK
jgi:hypothetical protein